jgi:hypothetical protein
MCVLTSYAYFRARPLGPWLDSMAVPQLRYFADSGAHSARTLGIHLDVDSYAEWLHRWEPWCTVYANLDVIWAPEATWENQRALEDRHGLNPVPVFHTGEPWSALHRYVDEGYTYIALGKLLGNPPSVLRPWLAECFRIACDRAVFHGFGLTQWPLLREFRFYSVDSSSWTSAVRFGYLMLFGRGRWQQVWLRDQASVTAHRDLLASYGLPLAACSARSYDRAAVVGACAAAVYRAAEWLRARHGLVHLPPGRGYPPAGTATVAKVEPAAAPGLHVYLADSSDTWLPPASRPIAKEMAR